MASEEGPRYRVEPTGPAKGQMRGLIAKTSTHSELRQLLDALEAVISNLELRPLVWGDPEYRTRREGGMVYHGIVWPLYVRYAAFAVEKIVWLFDVRALPNTPLAE